MYIVATGVIYVETEVLTNMQKARLDRWTTKFWTNKIKSKDTRVIFVNLFCLAMVAEEVFTNLDDITQALTAEKALTDSRGKIRFSKLVCNNPVYANFMITKICFHSRLSQEKLNG